MNNPQPVPEKVVTRGLIGEFGVVSVLQALSLSRQYTAVELFNDRGMLAGRVLLKSGVVLGAYVPDGPLEGADAFRTIVGLTLRSFQVERLPAPKEYPRPIGKLSAQLHAAHAASRRPPPNPALKTSSVSPISGSQPPRAFEPRLVPKRPGAADAGLEEPAPATHDTLAAPLRPSSRPHSRRPSGPPRGAAPGRIQKDAEAGQQSRKEIGQASREAAGEISRSV